MPYNPYIHRDYLDASGVYINYLHLHKRKKEMIRLCWFTHLRRLGRKPSYKQLPLKLSYMHPERLNLLISPPVQSAAQYPLSSGLHQHHQRYFSD